MRVAVIGSGYVGLVTGACFARTGNDVTCVDIDEAKIGRLSRGELPIHEPGLDGIVRENIAEGRLRFTTDAASAVGDARVVFLAVGTPPHEDGSADLSHVLAAAAQIAPHLRDDAVVVNKSTVPVGTADLVRTTIAGRTARRFHVCSNPEFLKEGAAVEDFMKPDRVVVGTDDEGVRRLMTELYAPFMRTGERIVFMDVRSAELTKYAANAMLASRISFMNQLAMLCEAVGADVSDVRHGLGMDRRIGKSFLFPGPGYGGSCFPKDVRALVHTCREAGVAHDLFDAIERVNERQQRVLLEKVRRFVPEPLASRRIAVWGLAFKAGTDDMRFSPALPLLDGLLADGAEVRVHDPVAMPTARQRYGDRVQYAHDPYAAAEGADALVVVTEWLVYRTPDFERLRGAMRRPLVIDGRNLYEPDRMREYGFAYHGIGRRQP